MAFLLPSHPSLTHLRTFTHSAPRLAKSSMKRLAHEHSAVPPYPHGVSQVYKQSNFGLYGQQKIRFGNMVSEKNEIKTRRHWRPNVKSKRLWSEALGRFVRTRVTTRVLRTIDKAGGLDEYLLGEKSARIKDLGMGGWKLRWRIMQTEAVRTRFAREREALGLPAKVALYKSLDANGLPRSREMVEREIREFDEQLAEGEEVGIGEEADPVEGVEPAFMREEPVGEKLRV